jgi:hypothetical protein
MPRILIIVVAAFIILAGGAITVMQQLEIGPFAPKPLVEGAEQGAEKAKSAPRNDPPRFVTLDPFVVPIIQNNGVAATVQIEIQLETTQSRESQLTKQMPRLMDAFGTDLRAFVPRHLRDHTQVDTEVLKKRLAIIGERVIGKGLFDAVLIQNILERKV